MIMWNKYKDVIKKQCVHCGKVMDINDFFKRKHLLKDGTITIRPRSICKICNGATSKKWAENNPDKAMMAYENYRERHNELSRKRYEKVGKLGPVMGRSLYMKLWTEKTKKINPERIEKYRQLGRDWRKRNVLRCYNNQAKLLSCPEKLARHNACSFFNSQGLSVNNVPDQLIDLKIKQIKLHRIINSLNA